MKRTYEPPQLTDFGSLTALTAANGLTEAEDGLGKITHTDGSSNSLFP